MMTNLELTRKEQSQVAEIVECLELKPIFGLYCMFVVSSWTCTIRVGVVVLVDPHPYTQPRPATGSGL